MSKNSSDDDERNDGLRPELNALRRQYRTAVKTKKYYEVWNSIEDCMHKERTADFVMERDDIALNVRNTICSAQIKRDLKNAKRLEDLLVEKDQICQLMENQQLTNDSLDKDIINFEEKVQNQRVETSKFVHNKSCMSASAKAHLKRQSVLENRLNREESKSNAILASNQKLRDRIATLVNEKHKFERKYQNLDGKYEKLKSEMANILDMSLSTYEQVADVNTRQRILQEKGEHEFNQYNSDQMEMEIDIKHREAWIKFMEILYNQRGEYKSLKHQREIEAQIKADEERFEKLKTLEAAWKRILECVKIDEDTMSLMMDKENYDDNISLNSMKSKENESQGTRPGTRETVMNSRPGTRESRMTSAGHHAHREHHHHHGGHMNRQTSDNTHRTTSPARKHSSTVSFSHDKKPIRTRSGRMANKVNMIIEKSERFEEKVFALYTENNYQHESIENMTEELVAIEKQILNTGIDLVNYQMSGSSCISTEFNKSEARYDAASQLLEMNCEENTRKKLDDEYTKNYQILDKYSDMIKSMSSMISLNIEDNQENQDPNIETKNLVEEFGRIEGKLNSLVNGYFCLNRDQPEVIASWSTFTNPERKSSSTSNSTVLKLGENNRFQHVSSPKHSPKNSPRTLRNKVSDMNASALNKPKQVTLDKIPAQGGFTEDEKRLEKLRTTILEPLSTVDVRKKPILLSNKLQNSRFAKALAGEGQEDIPEECMDDLEHFVTDNEFLDLDECWKVAEKHYEKRIDKISYMAKYNRRSTLRKISIFQRTHLN